MFGYKTIKAQEIEALKAKIDSLEGEVKGYYENAADVNEYFKAIAPLLQGFSVRDNFLDIGRLDIKSCYEGCAPAYGIINKIAKAVGEMFPFLELVRRSDGKQVEKHFILDMLAQPNDRYTTRRFGQAWATQRLAFGDCFVYTKKEVGVNLGQGKSMFVLPGQRIEVKRGGYLRPMEGITITGSGSKTVIEPADFFESFNFNMDDTDFFGTSPLVVAAAYLSVMDRGIRRQDQTLKNGGPSALVTPKPDSLGVAPVTADALTEELNGGEVKGQIKALRTAIEVHQLGLSSVDLGILSSHKEAVTALCFIYDIPVDLYYGQSKYENAKEAKKALYESNAIPLANEFGEDLLNHFKLAGEFTLTVNTDKIDVLQDDPGDVLDNLAKMGASLNEKREAYGYEPRPEPWADLPMVPMSTMFGGEGITDINEAEPAE